MTSKYPNIRLYAQLKPDAEGVRHLIEVQSRLPAQRHGRAVAPRQLHMTLIHFGKVHDVYQTLHQLTGICYDQYATHLQKYIQQTDLLLPMEAAVVAPRGFARYGQRGGTLVIEYDVPEWILETHANLVGVLREFFHDCGVENIPEFMANDINFMHATQLSAHITLYKGYVGELPTIKLLPAQVAPTPLVYPPLNP